MLRVDKNSLFRWSLMAIMTVSVVFPRTGGCVVFEYEHSVSAEEVPMHAHAHSHQHSFDHDSPIDCRTLLGRCSEDENSRHHHHCFVCCDSQTYPATTKAVSRVSFKRFNGSIFFDIADFQALSVDSDPVPNRYHSFVPLRSSALPLRLHLLYGLLLI